MQSSQLLMPEGRKKNHFDLSSLKLNVKCPSQSCPSINSTYQSYVPRTWFLAWIIVPQCLFQSTLSIAVKVMDLKHSYIWWCNFLLRNLLWLNTCEDIFLAGVEGSEPSCHCFLGREWQEHVPWRRARWGPLVSRDFKGWVFRGGLIEYSSPFCQCTKMRFSLLICLSLGVVWQMALH